MKVSNLLFSERIRVRTTFPNKTYKKTGTIMSSFLKVSNPHLSDPIRVRTSFLSQSCNMTRRTLDLLSWTLHREVHLSRSHISEPLFAGGTSVFRVKDITPPPNLPHSHTAPWLPLHQQNTKANSIQSMHDFIILSIGYSPIWPKNVQNLYMNIENKFLIPPVFLQLFWGLHIFFFWGGGDIDTFWYPKCAKKMGK